MARIFSAFPSGRAGSGLIALRLALAFELFTDGVERFSAQASPAVTASLSASALGVLQVVCACAVLAGFLTPIVQLVVGAMAVGIVGYHVSMSGWALPLQAWQSSSCVLALAISAGLLGPGAYSVDARMFGRREIVFGHGP